MYLSSADTNTYWKMSAVPVPAQFLLLPLPNTG